MGFIGSLYQFERISWLVGTAAALRYRGTPCQVLVIGHGEDAGRIRAAIGEARAEDYIRVLPAVPHDQVRRYYSLMDDFPTCS
jgi:glycosyltransferase involved in cell wall biosynthesis